MIIIMENGPVVVVDPDNIQRSHRHISFMRIKYISTTRERPSVIFVQLLYITVCSET